MGYGDEIMATAEAREEKKRHLNSKIVIGNGVKVFPSVIFLNNPNIYQGKLEKNHSYIWVKNYIGNRPYIDYKNTNAQKIFWNNNFAPIPGDIFFTQEEINIGNNVKKKTKEIWEEKFGKKSKFLVVIEPNVKGDNYSKLVGTKIHGDSNLNRDWGFEKWQQVVNALKDQVTFIQTFRGNVRKLANVVDIECNFRSAISIINNSDLFVGTNGGLIQAAAALQKPTINILGGWISPKVIGYDYHTNFYVDIVGSPCGSRTRCDHCEECMKMIKVDDIISAIKNKLNK